MRDERESSDIFYKSHKRGEKIKDDKIWECTTLATRPTRPHARAAPSEDETTTVPPAALLESLSRVVRHRQRKQANRATLRAQRI
jgi:hypothetical protein